MKMSNYDLATINIDIIDVHDVKYLPPTFDSDILFVLHLVTLGDPSAYGQSMDGINTTPMLFNQNNKCPY